MNKNRISLPNVTTKSQIGLVVRDARKRAEQISELFGIGPFIEEMYPGISATVHGKPAEFKMVSLTADMGPSLELELCQVLEGRPIHQEFLETRGEGFHHLGVYVRDFRQEIKKWEEKGIKVLQWSLNPPQYPEGSGYAYMDTEKLIGVIIEIADIPSPALQPGNTEK
jgi:methylmalonyl-CoA/ethylmalonyl-CoA epimerase